MTIALVTPGWPGRDTANGIATAVYHMAMGLKAEGHNPIIIALRIDGPTPEDFLVVEVVRRSWTVTEKVMARLGVSDIAQTVFAESIADAVERAAKVEELDAILIEETQGWAVTLIERRIAPVVVYLHGPWLLHKVIQSSGDVASDIRREAREAKAFQAASALVAPSRHVLDAVEASVDICHVPRVVIPNAFAADMPPRGPGAENLILFVGRFDKHKGGDLVLESFRRLHARRPDARLTFVGPDRGVRQQNGRIVQMTEMLDDLPEATRRAITVLGHQTAEQIAALRQTHGIAVVASRYEVFGLTVLEAMAAGQAIVATRVGGPAEILENQRTALLVPAENAGAMADALEKLMDDVHLAALFGKAARAHLEQRFAPPVIAAETAAFLTRLL